jgi:hypothetical protein
MSDELRQHVRMPILELLRHRQALDWWLPRPVSRQCNRRLGACLLGLERCGGGVVSQLPLCRRCARPRHPRRRKRLALRRPSGRVHVLACQHTRRAGDGRSAWALASSSDEESSSSFFKRRTAGGTAGCAGMPPSDVAELRFETARLQTASATARLVLGRLLGVTTHSVSASPTPSRAYGSGPTSKQCALKSLWKRAHFQTVPLVTAASAGLGTVRRLLALDEPGWEAMLRTILARLLQVLQPLSPRR